MHSWLPVFLRGSTRSFHSYHNFIITFHGAGKLSLIFTWSPMYWMGETMNFVVIIMIIKKVSGLGKSLLILTAHGGYICLLVKLPLSLFFFFALIESLQKPSNVHLAWSTIRILRVCRSWKTPRALPVWWMSYVMSWTLSAMPSARWASSWRFNIPIISVVHSATLFFSPLVSF